VFLISFLILGLIFLFYLLLCFFNFGFNFLASSDFFGVLGFFGVFFFALFCQLWFDFFRFFFFFLVFLFVV